MKTNTNNINKSLRVALPLAILAATLSTAGAATLANKSQFYGDSTAGAGYQAFVADETGTSAYTLRGYARAYGYVLGKNVDIATADGRATSYDGGTGVISANARVFGISVWNYVKGGNTTWNDSFEYIKEVTIANLDFAVGPVVVNVKGGVSLKATNKLEFKIEALDPNAAVYTPVLKASMKPRFEAALTATGGLNALVIKPSLQARLTLVDVELPAEASLKPVIVQPAPAPVVTAIPLTTSRTATFSTTSSTSSTSSLATSPTQLLQNQGRTFLVAWNANLILKTLGGKVDAVVEYFNPNPFDWGWHTYRKTIISWVGFTSNTNLTSGSRAITLGGGPMVSTQ
jgi:hypothetical protein